MLRSSQTALPTSLSLPWRFQGLLRQKRQRRVLRQYRQETRETKLYRKSKPSASKWHHSWNRSRVRKPRGWPMKMQPELLKKWR